MDKQVQRLRRKKNTNTQTVKEQFINNLSRSANVADLRGKMAQNSAQTAEMLKCKTIMSRVKYIHE